MSIIKKAWNAFLDMLAGPYIPITSCVGTAIPEYYGVSCRCGATDDSQCYVRLNGPDKPLSET